jgi:hypothetical protein
MDRLAARLAALAEEGVAFSSIPPEITPIESIAGTRIQVAGSEVIVGADGSMTHWGKRMAGIDELKDELEMEHARMRMDKEIRPFYVWADRSVPAARVNAILAAAPEGVEVRLAFAEPERRVTAYEEELLAVPRVKQRFKELEGAADLSERARLFAEAGEQAIGLRCAPLIKAYVDLAGRFSDQRYKISAARLPEAIRECGCNVGDLVVLEYLLLFDHGAFQHPARSIPAEEAASVLR